MRGREPSTLRNGTSDTSAPRSQAVLLWVDLEMTGLDPKKDKILEVAAIATDMI